MISVNRASLHTIDLKTRMPFRFGIATLTEVKHAFLTVEADIDGERVTGTAADHLFPKWFTKDPEKTLDAEVNELLQVVRHAVSLALETEGPTLFAFWERLYDRQLEWGNRLDLEPLLSLFGVTLVERALLEALAKRRSSTVGDLIRSNALGIDLARTDPALAGQEPAALLPATSLPSVSARHTVGLTDPLIDADIPDDERLTDGLPHSLEACIAAYGLAEFKIKVCGQLEQDVPRLRELAEVITRAAPSDFTFSLDGNEQFGSCESFHAFWLEVVDDPRLRSFFEHVLFIEQPLSRKAALADDVAAMREWHGLPPVIIDESDATVESTPRALTLGYAGTSHKNCKGVLRGILNRCLINHRARENPGHRFLMSGEDLVNIGPVALLQDLEIQSILGNASVERNGHHYIAGLSAFPVKTCAALLKAHPDLYRRTEAGWPTLRIERGKLDLSSLHRAPFAVGFDLPLEEYEAVAVP